MATKSGGRARFMVCVRNTGYPASLEVRKIYRALPDRDAERHAMLRIVDESGEDYLYPAKFFMAVNLSQPLRYALRHAG
jgi:hypothetical protein